MAYGLTSFGVSLDIHYCCGKIKFVEVCLSEKCTKESSKTSHECCTTKRIVSSDNSNGVTQSVVKFKCQKRSENVVAGAPNFIPASVLHIAKLPNNNKRSFASPIYLMNMVFRL